MALWLILLSLGLGCRLREGITATSGFPLTVVPSYDSSNPRDVDFGVGWSLALNDLDVQIDEDRQIVTDFIDDEPFSLRVGGGRDVTLTLPDGRRTTFRYYLDAHSLGGVAGLTYAAKWEAEPGVTATLQTEGAAAISQDSGDNMLATLPGGFVHWWPVVQSTPLENHDLPGFVLKLQDDTKYFIHREDLSQHDVEISQGRMISAQAYGKARVARLERPNGEYLLISKNGIDHYLPGSSAPTRSLYFDRGVGNRIVAVRDAQDQIAKNTPMVRYEYDSAGNLVYVHKLQSKSGAGSDAKYATTTYVYGKPEFPHFITEIIDPRGVKLARNTYYPAGNANGKCRTCVFGLKSELFPALSTRDRG